MLGCIAIMGITSAHAMDVRAQAHCYNAKGKTKHNIQVDSIHKAYFLNDTNLPQTIIVMYKLCAQFMPCKREDFTVTVKAHTTWTHEKRLGIMISYTRLGKYRSSAETTITGPKSGREFSQAKVEVDE